jgi:hypothetical protein
MTRSKMLIVLVALTGISASPAAGQAVGGIYATATVIDMGQARITHQAAMSLARQVGLATMRSVNGAALPGIKVREDIGPVTLFMGDAVGTKEIDSRNAQTVTAIYW